LLKGTLSNCANIITILVVILLKLFNSGIR
jgi:hypothetical protein